MLLYISNKSLSFTMWLIDLTYEPPTHNFASKTFIWQSKTDPYPKDWFIFSKFFPVSPDSRPSTNTKCYLVSHILTWSELILLNNVSILLMTLCSRHGYLRYIPFSLRAQTTVVIVQLELDLPLRLQEAQSSNLTNGSISVFNFLSFLLLGSGAKTHQHS
jgi:hypothetical protein